MSNRSVLLQGIIAGPQRTRKLVVEDTFTQGATQISLENHTPDYADQSLIGAAWAKNPISTSSAALGGSTIVTAQQGQAYNASGGSVKAFYNTTIDPSSADYRITAVMRMITPITGGNVTSIAARMDGATDTGYMAHVAVNIAAPVNSDGIATGAPCMEVVLEKHVASVATTLQTKYLAASAQTVAGVSSTPATANITNASSSATITSGGVGAANGMVVAHASIPPGTTLVSGAGSGTWILSAPATATVTGATITPGIPYELWTIVLDASNDEKVVYVQGPADAVLKRVCSSGDNAINSPGLGGIFFNRSTYNLGQHVDYYRLEVNGPQPIAGTNPAATPDPTQSASLLWTPNYDANIGNNAAADTGATGAWYREQESRVRGTITPDRISIVAAGADPGSGTYRPTTAMMRVENRRLDSSAAGDFTGSGGANQITATAVATAVATTITTSTGDATALRDKDIFYNHTTGERLRVNGTPSGTSVPVLRGQSTVAAAIAVGDVFSVYTGDVNDSGSLTNAYVTSREEVYSRSASEFGGSSGTAAVSWPDPVGSVRWYGVSYLIPTASWPGNSNYANIGTAQANPWLTLAQFKGQFGGSPPRALGIDVKQGANGRWIIDGGGGRLRITLGDVVPGVWTRFVIGMRLETNSVNGWITVYQDGTLVVPKRSEATMDKKSDGTPDPIYLKDGIYRTKDWQTTHIVYLGPIKIGTTMSDVTNA